MAQSGWGVQPWPVALVAVGQGDALGSGVEAAGAPGFVSKSSGLGELVSAVRAAARDNLVEPPA